MFRRLLLTVNDFTLTVMRLVFGIVFFAHGAQKALGWFGGPGYAATMAGFTQMGISHTFGMLAIAAEFLGGLGLIAGLLGRVAALGVMCNMGVAIFTVHLHQGLFMNWTGSKSGEGFEFHLLALVIGLSLLVRGSGPLSVDYSLTHHRPARIRGFSKA
jgi:putative oxidoreductase